MKRRVFVQSSLLLAPGLPAFAQDKWPSKPLTYVVPLAAGGATDILGRMISQKLSENLGVPVVVENKTGAGGGIGSEFVARAPADGYTLLGGAISTHAINVSLYPNLGYDPIKSFVPIAMIGFNPLLLVVPPNSPFRSVNDIVQAAKKDPGSVRYASAGNGTSMHLAAELFAFKTGTKLSHIPYRGSAPALHDVMGGQVDMLFDTAVACATYVQAGRLRALATGSKARLEAFPEIPTVIEAGVADFDVASWLAVFARSGTDPAIAQRLQKEVNGILSSPESLARMKQLGTLAAPMAPDQMTQFLQSEIAKWKQVIVAAGIKL